MPTVHGYARVSTADQAGHGHMMEGYRRQCEAEFEKNWKPEGYVWGHMWEDPAVSGATAFDSRPMGFRLNNTVESGDVILFPKLDRAFRSTRDALRMVDLWKDRGIRAVFLDFKIDYGTDTGRFMFTLLVAGAELFRNQGRTRTLEGLAVARAKGRKMGRPPFGMRYVGPKEKREAVTVPEEFNIGRQIVKWKMEGYGYGDIATHLNVQNVPRPKRRSGGNWDKAIKNRWAKTSVVRAYRSTLRVLDLIEKKKCRQL